MKGMWQRGSKSRHSAGVSLGAARQIQHGFVRAVVLSSAAFASFASFASSASCASSAARITRHTMPSNFVRNLLKTKKRAPNYSTHKRGVGGSRKTLCQRQVCFGVQRRIGAFAGDESRVTRGGDHGGIVGRKRAAREIDFDSAASAFRLKRAAKLAIGRHAAGGQDSARAEFFGRRKRARQEIIHHGA